jgi:hypothetical protein
MSSLRNYSIFFGAFLGCAVLFAGACGGGESRPGPLKHHLDDMFIAQIPIAEKQSVIQAQQDYNVAKMEHAKAQADYNDAATDLEVARNELQQARLDEKTAKTRKQSAEKTADLNRINAAALLEREAEVAREAADKKVAYMDARRKFLKEYINHSEDNMYAQEARYELTKARLAQSKNIRPRGMVMADYEKQAQVRAEYAQRSKVKIDQDKSDLARMRKEWKALAKDAGKPDGGAETPIKQSTPTGPRPDTTPAADTKPPAPDTKAPDTKAPDTKAPDTQTPAAGGTGATGGGTEGASGDGGGEQ